MANNIFMETIAGDGIPTVSDISEVTGALGGLEKTVKNLAAAVAGAFAIGKVAQYLKETAVSSGRLDKQLLVLRLSLGKLKAAIGRAAAPIAEVLLPLLQQAVWGVTRFVNAAGQVIRALLGGSEASDALADSTQAASDAQKTLLSVGTKVKRTLADFDEITRLNSADGSSVTAQLIPGEVDDTISPQLQKIVNRIQSLLEPLRQIDFSAAVAAFEKLRGAVSSLGTGVFDGLNWAWHNLLVPLAAWTIQDFLPAFLTALSNGLKVLGNVVTALQPLVQWLWENFLEPVAQWTGQMIIQALTWLGEKLQGLSSWIGQNQPLLQKMAAAVAAVAAAVTLANGVFGNWNLLGGLAVGVTDRFRNAISLLSNPITLVGVAITAAVAAVALLISNWQNVRTAAASAWESVRSIWGNAAAWFLQNVQTTAASVWGNIRTTAASAWESVRSIWGNAAAWFRQYLLTPLSNGFRSTVNGIIGFLNAMIAGIVSGINALVESVNKIRFQIPSWIPGLGGRQLGFSLQRVSVPRIPYLAQGAVLPANRPFMAVVGDQRHGTNIEAPLAIIQEAVAQVMNDNIAAMMAGFDASVGVQKEILEAVLGIQIGDEVIGRAADRYSRKMAVMRGGAW